MINIDSWIDLEPSTPISHEVRILDNTVEIRLGPPRGQTPLIHLMLPDPEICGRLAQTIAQAGHDFAAELRQRDDQPEKGSCEHIASSAA